MRLNQDLVNLLRALEGRVGDADKKTINEVLQDVRLFAMRICHMTPHILLIIRLYR